MPQLSLFSDMIGDVYRFNQEVIGTVPPEKPQTLPPLRLLFALTAMYEELNEFTVASNTGDVGEAVDAMIDLIYFAIGRCYEMGISTTKLNECWRLVQEKNMQKSPGRKNRGTDIDAVKPEGWEAANLNEVLQ